MEYIQQQGAPIVVEVRLLPALFCHSCALASRVTAVHTAFSRSGSTMIWSEYSVILDRKATFSAQLCHEIVPLQLHLIGQLHSF